jgi:DNA replication licensing factor MCM2
VEAGKIPRSKEVTLTGDQVDSVRPGDELNLTGIYRCLQDAVTNARTNFPVYRTVIDAVHIERSGDVKIEHVTDEEQERIMTLSRDPNIRERFIASMAPSIYGMKHVKTAIALSMMGGQSKVAAGKHRIRGDINTLIVGDPGLAKSQFLKYVEQTFPRAVYTTGKGASAVGLTAAVQRDETGQFCLQGGAMVLADDGICLIDEFDKMTDQDRTSIHEAMEQQTISVSKAGIVATLQARCAVIAVANPLEGKYDSARTFAQNVNLTDPILSRFDVLCVLRDESDAFQDERLADHVVCSHIRSHPDANARDKAVKPRLQQKAVSYDAEPIPQDLLKKYVIFARQRVKPQVSDIDKEKLATFYKDIRQEAFRSGGAPMTARHIESIIRLAEASARIELRQHVTTKDLDFAISIMLESFIQSQKHAVAEEMRKKFRLYIACATPLSDQFMRLLDRLFRDKAEELRLKGQDVFAADVSVAMTDVVSAIERNDLDMEEAMQFMRSERFRQNFHLDGDVLRQTFA